MDQTVKNSHLATELYSRTTKLSCAMVTVECCSQQTALKYKFQYIHEMVQPCNSAASVDLLQSNNTAN